MFRIACLLVVVTASTARAQTFDWINSAGGTYSTPGNWSPAGPPGVSGVARFALNSTYTVSFTGNATVLRHTVSTGDVTWNLNGFTFQQTDTINNGVGNNVTPTTLRILNGNLLPGNFSVGGTAGVVSNAYLSQGVDMTVGAGVLYVGTSGTGFLSVAGGSTVTTTTGLAGLGLNASGVGTMLLTDAGTMLTVPTTFRLASAGTGTLTVQNGATANFAGLDIGQTTGAVGVLNVSGAGAAVTVNSTTNIGGTFAGFAAASATLNVSGGATVSLNGTTNLRTTATVNLTGGTLNLGTLNFAPGAQMNWSAGTVQFASGTDITGSVLDLLFAGSNTLGTGRTLGATLGVMSLDTPLVVAGGTLNAPTLNVNAPLSITGFGRVNASDSVSIGAGQVVTVSDFGKLTAAGSITNTGGLLQLNGPASTVASFTANDFGVIQGTGRFSGGLNNGTGGTIRARSGDHLIIDGIGNSNPGNIELSGGTLEYTKTLSNLANGFISGRGEFRGGTSVPGSPGLANIGVVALSAGITDIRGDVSNTGAGRIVAAGGAVVTFYDDVTHNGAEIRTNSGARTVFFGGQSGAGPFTGTGIVEYNGDLRPGNSPANVLYDGAVEFTSTARFFAEIGGPNFGSDYDRLTIAGGVTLGGASLQLQLINGYTPAPGQQFTLVDFTGPGPITGAFAGLGEGAILSAGGMQFLLSYVGGTGNDVTVTAVPEPSTIFLISLAGLGAAHVRRRRAAR